MVLIEELKSMDIVNKVGGRFKLSALIQKRMLELMEGSRPLLVEMQALVCNSYLAMPRRTTIGVDPNRVSVLVAVLAKRGGVFR